ncbi:MAG: hypothetical protein ACRDQ1_06090, partial [Sciscionella sp.]
VGIGVVSFGLIAARLWARTPAIVLQLLLLGVAYFALQARRADLALPVAAVSVATLVLLFVASSRSWAAGEHDAAAHADPDADDRRPEDR